MKICSAYIGLGSNQRDPVRQLDLAVAALRNSALLRVRIVSPYYRNAAILPEEDKTPQPDYINAVAAVDTMLTARALLETLLAIETTLGRLRDGRRWVPRVIDLDLLLYDDVMIDEPDLQIPHPELTERAFVLYPLYDIAPELTIPGQGRLIDFLNHSHKKALHKVTVG